MKPDLCHANVWVVIPTFNRDDDLIECLHSLGEAEIVMENVIVVDNGSQDKTIEKLSRNYPQVHLIALDINLGATGGSNTGFKFALEHGADAVIRMDSDVVVDTNFLEPLLEVAKSDPKIGIVGPKIYYFDSPKEIWYAGAYSNKLFLNVKKDYRHEFDTKENSIVKEVDYVWGATMMISKEVLEKTGGFDTDFFIYHEEIEFCGRVQDLDFSIYFVPNSFVWHKVGSLSNSEWISYNWNKSKMLLYQKRAHNLIHKLFLIFYAFIYSLGDSLLNMIGLRKRSGNRGPLTSALHGLIDGLCGN